MLAPEEWWPESGKPAPVAQPAAKARKQGRPAARVVSLHADAGPRAAPPAPLLPLNQPLAATSTRPAAELVAEPSCLCAGRPVAPGAPAAVLEAAASPTPADSGSAECKAAPRAVATGGPAAFPVAGSVEGSDASGASLSSSSSDASGAEAKPAQRTRDLWGGDDAAGDFAEGAPCALGGKRLVPPLLLDIPGRVYAPPLETPTPCAHGRTVAQRVRDLVRPLSVRRLGPLSARGEEPPLQSARQAGDCAWPPSPGLLCGLLPRSARPTPGADNMAAPLLRSPGMPPARALSDGGSPAGASTPRGTLLWRLLSPRRLPRAHPGDVRNPKVPALETVVSVGPQEGAQAAALAAPQAQPPQSAPPRANTAAHEVDSGAEAEAPCKLAAQGNAGAATAAPYAHQILITGSDMGSDSVCGDTALFQGRLRYRAAPL